MAEPGIIKQAWYRLWTSRRSRLFVFLVILVAVLAVVFSEGLLAVGSHYGDQWATHMVDDALQGNNETGIVLLGHVYNLDIPSRQASIAWWLLGCGGMKLAGTGSFSSNNVCGVLDGEIDLYFDGASEPNYSYNLQANAFKPGSQIPIFIQAMTGFSTDHLLVLYAWRGLDQPYGYPFDGYQLDTMVIALDSNTNESLPILAVLPISATNNFHPYLSFDLETESRNATGGLVKSRAMEVAFARTGFARTYVMTLFLVNWALTATVAWITVSAIVSEEMSEGIILLPISVILTIPQLRALWDGAPAFGLLLDSCGTFLNMVIVSVSSCFLVVHLATQAAHRKAQEANNGAPEGSAQGARAPTNSSGTPVIGNEKFQIGVADSAMPLLRANSTGLREV